LVLEDGLKQWAALVVVVGPVWSGVKLIIDAWQRTAP
jgi:hypothetical protein